MGELNRHRRKWLKKEAGILPDAVLEAIARPILLQ